MHRDTLKRGFHLEPGPLGDRVTEGLEEAARAARGLWQRDPSTWSRDRAVQAGIAQRLGWLSSADLMAESSGRLAAVAERVRKAGFEDIVLLGMGGSSLAPEVLRAIVGVQPGWPRLQMLDSTDPEGVRGVATTPSRTLFLLASKSGTTIEPNALAAHFRRVLTDAGVTDWGSHFIAITDEGTALAERARTERFREVLINPSDIGGRYSALSFFGLLPAALMGQNVMEIVRWGQAMFEEARAADDVAQNPAVGLGLLMAVGARAGRDKLTLVVPPRLEPFGLWIEQLVAESTGKQGIGIVPIAGENLGAPGVYGRDRVFVRLRAEGDPGEQVRDQAVTRLGKVPIVTIAFPEPAALGAEFARWEIATAVAGALLDINPFDEPNVQQAKDATAALLGRFKSDGRLPTAVPDDTRDGVTFSLTTAARSRLGGRGPASFLTLLAPGDYVAILAYLKPSTAIGRLLHGFRMSVRDRSGAATMQGYGPRYLHSTGQLHKGGPDSGVFVLVTATPGRDLEIPGETFSFGTLELAQAIGDFASLEQAGRRGVHVHLPVPDPQRLEATLARLLEPLSST
jgi:glucose-6-phosphate isomerase